MSYNFGYIENLVFHKYINKESVVYDIGAYKAEYTKLFSSLGKEVIAFEPSVNNFPILLDNTKNLDNVKCHQVALHERKYDCVTRFKECNGTEDPEQPISYVVLGDYVRENNLPLPSLVKCDCEGNESFLFKTFDVLFENRTIYWLELHYPVSKNAEQPQTYKDNPSWVFWGSGGYNWNEIKGWDYHFIGIKGNNAFLLDENLDYNENLHFEGALIIPKEKWEGI